MFRYIKDHFANIEGVNIYPVISLLIFFVFFIALLYYVKNMDKNKVEEISHLPLDGADQLADTYSQTNLKKV
jgi:hypothetical protein